MLIEFEVGNYLSFKKPVRLSMLAANPIKDYPAENTFEAGRYRLLKSAVIYGANASGKSNLISAMAFMRWFVLNSSKETQVEEKIQVTPFKLDTATEYEPSHFEICFLHNGQRYRYGFEVDKFNIRKEWLFYIKKIKEVALFLREDDGIDISKDFSEGKGLEEKTRDNALFLSVVAQFNGTISGSILKWFQGFRALHGLYDHQYEKFTVNLMQNESARLLLVDLIRRADVGISDMLVQDLPTSEDDGQKGLMKDPQRKIFNLKYEILNKKNSVVFSSQVSERIIGNQLEKTLHVPENLPSGSYKIRVSLFDGANLLSGESSFIFVDMPMLNLGGGITLTYLQLVNYVGWLVIILLLLFLFFGFMFVLEYYFFKEALFTVDERNLSKQGMIPRRKGVSQ